MQCGGTANTIPLQVFWILKVTWNEEDKSSLWSTAVIIACLLVEPKPKLQDRAQASSITHLSPLPGCANCFID